MDPRDLTVIARDSPVDRGTLSRLIPSTLSLLSLYYAVRLLQPHVIYMLLIFRVGVLFIGMAAEW